MYCESDQASLCWDCDEKVHRANFLVAKHSRSLLCHVCQSLTPWKASGAKLGPTVSVCDACVAAAAQCKARDGTGVVRRENQSERSDGGGDVNEAVDDYDDVEGDYDDDDEDDDDDEEEEFDLDEDDENQVVPWSGESQSPPPVSCSSSNSSRSEEEVSLLRRRDFADLYSDDEIGCSSSHMDSRATANEEANTSTVSFRPLKQPRITTASEPDDGQAESRSTAIINSLHRLQKQMITNDDGGDDASATVLAICRLSKDEGR
ncbi:hypothetical protein JRO89_XS15G0134000 [Xanthoceras sorbifolium]|uniref:B box-type domain-containing protein n=1 Tax=Xanthoceras sorbifolium TaxID=99658 RepID=A0ABQ8H1Z7_9ROSI|nr:hypothetical protein JRO89_XS15G0134000 [Xanthoceras sorbifolium]